MPLTREKKAAVVSELSELLNSSKMVVFASYTGTPVKAMQELRKSAQENGTKLKVVKNRLFKQALSTNDKLKAVDSSGLTGQLLYAFNSEDEVAPAQSLASFARTSPTIEFVGAITEDAQLLSAEDVKSLANLPNKQQLRAQLAGLLSTPQRNFVSVLAGNMKSVLYVLSARAETLAE